MNLHNYLRSFLESQFKLFKINHAIFIAATGKSVTPSASHAPPLKSQPLCANRLTEQTKHPQIISMHCILSVQIAGKCVHIESVCRGTCRCWQILPSNSTLTHQIETCNDNRAAFVVQTRRVTQQSQSDRDTVVGNYIPEVLLPVAAQRFLELC